MLLSVVVVLVVEQHQTIVPVVAVGAQERIELLQVSL